MSLLLLLLFVSTATTRANDVDLRESATSAGSMRSVVSSGHFAQHHNLLATRTGETGDELLLGDADLVGNLSLSPDTSSPANTDRHRRDHLRYYRSVKSLCYQRVRNDTYVYKRWNNDCRAAIGKGFRCFDVDNIIAGTDASNSSTKVPLFIKLHKVGGTTLGDILHSTAETRHGSKVWSVTWTTSSRAPQASRQPAHKL